MELTTCAYSLETSRKLPSAPLLAPGHVSCAAREGRAHRERAGLLHTHPTLKAPARGSAGGLGARLCCRVSVSFFSKMLCPGSVGTG